MCVLGFLSSVAALLTCRSMGTAAGRYIGQPLNEVNPVRRDTFLIPAYNWMIIQKRPCVSLSGGASMLS